MGTRPAPLGFGDTTRPPHAATSRNKSCALCSAPPPLASHWLARLSMRRVASDWVGVLWARPIVSSGL